MHESTIRELKRDIRALERADLLGESDKMIAIASKIVNSAQTIISGGQTPLTASIQPKSSLSKAKPGQSIEILYKPVTVPNPLDGDYLIRFSAMRTQDLKRAGILDIHNSYWTKNEVIGGNIYGSVPVSIIDSDAQRKLLSAGWEKVSCSTAYFGADKDVQTISQDYKRSSANYLLIRENVTHQILAIILP